MGTVSIRAMLPGDLEALCDLKWQMNLSEIAAIPAGSWVGSDRAPGRPAAVDGMVATIAKAEDKGGAVLVAVDDAGRIVGCVSWWPELASPSYRDESRRHAFLAGFAVAENQRSRGVGARLLAEVERQARARGLTRLLLNTSAHNARGIAFYQRHGFEPVAVSLGKRLD